MARSRSGALIEPTTCHGSPSRRRESTSQMCTGPTPSGGLGAVRDPGEHLADPGVVVPHGLPIQEPGLGHRAVALDHLPELVPAGIAPQPLAPLVVVAKLGVRDADPEVPQLGDVRGEELLTEVLVRPGLDPPVQEDVLLGLGRLAEEVHDRPPPSVHGVLEHVPLLRCSADELQGQLLAVTEVERFLRADPAHGPDVGHVRAVEEGLLRDQGRAVDQPPDHRHVAPRLRRVVEDVVELRTAVDQVVEHLLPALAQVLGHPVQDLSVARLVLDLGREGELPAERRGPGDPLPFGQAAHHLRVGVHLDELEERLAILVGHPVPRLDLLAGVDAGFELGPALFVAHDVSSLAPRPARRRSVNRSATSPGDSGPSGRYHVYDQFAADSTRSLANRGSASPGSSRTIRSHSRSYRRRSRRTSSFRGPVRAFHSWWNTHASSRLPAMTETWARIAIRRRSSGGSSSAPMASSSPRNWLADWTTISYSRSSLEAMWAYS